MTQKEQDKLQKTKEAKMRQTMPSQIGSGTKILTRSLDNFPHDSPTLSQKENGKIDPEIGVLDRD